MARKHSKAHRRTTLKRQRGGYYSFDGAVAPGAAAYSRANEVAAPSYVTGGRRRKSRKGRKGRKTRKMKGGSSFGNVSASFQGTGVKGMADFVGTGTRGPYSNGGSGGGAFNNYGAAPGSSF